MKKIALVPAWIHAILFFSIPLFFLHFPLLFSDSSPLGYGYESGKVWFFIAGSILLFFCSLPKITLSKKQIIFLLTLIGILAFSVLVSPYPLLAIIGNDEKNHGALFFLALIGYYYVAKSLADAEGEKILSLTPIVLLPIFLYALVQFMGLDSLEKLYEGNAFSEGVFSTFGNANYLAGYILLLTPFVLRSKRWVLFVSLTAMLLLLFGAKAILAILLFGFIVLFHLLTKANINKKVIYGIMVLLLSGGVITTLLFFPAKVDDLMARFILWEEVLKLNFHSILHFLFGYGPDTLEAVFAPLRSKLLNSYVPVDIVIDRAHNVFIDIFYSFGFLGLGSFVFMLIHFLKSKSSISKEIIILFLVFFFFNVPSVSHWLLLVFALTLPTVERSLKI